MIKFNLQLFAIAGGAQLSKLSVGGGGSNKKKKIDNPVTTTKNNVVQLPSVTPVESEADKQRRLNAEADKKRYEADVALSEEYKAKGEVDPTRMTMEQRKAAKNDSVVAPGFTPKTTTETVETPSKQDIQEQILQRQRDLAIENFKQAFARTEGQLKAEEEALAPAFREKRTGVRTEDVMARTGAEKLAATQGLSGSGFRGQAELAQNVLTQGAIGALNEQELEAKADIQRRLSEARSLMEQGIATAETQADIALLEAQLKDLEDKENLALAEAERVRSEYISTLGRFGQDYTAEINRIIEEGDPNEQWKIQYLEAARQQKITDQNLDPLTGKPLGVTKDDATLEERAWKKISARIPLTSEEAQVLGVQEGYLAPRTTTGTGGGLSASSTASLAKWKWDNGVPLTAEEARILGVPEGAVNPNISGGNNFLETADTILNPVTIDTISDNKKSTLERLINNPELHGNDPTRLQAILDDQGISLEELEVYEDWRDRALSAGMFQ